MDIKSQDLKENGERKIEWAAHAMPVLGAIKARFEKERPLEKQRIAACLHVTAETANLVRTLEAGGAEIRLCASNPLSTQDDVAAALATKSAVEVYAVRGEDRERYFQHLRRVADLKPTITVDDGADLVSLLHSERRDLLEGVKGGTEETTTGVKRIQSMAREKALHYPVVAVNNALTKHLFDNRYGTGQSTIDGILRATNRLLAGSCFVVAGYGWCGRGLAARASGMGARVVVTEMEPIRALEAVMDGYTVLPMTEASKIGDFFCTVTGNTDVISETSFQRMRDGAVVSNAGHFNVEVDVEALLKMSTSVRQVRDSLEEYLLGDGRRIYLVGEGRLANLAAAEGHPPDVMDMSFANQALAVEYLSLHSARLAPDVFDVPKEIDTRIAELKLKSLGVSIDSLTDRQQQYLASWRCGT